MTAVTELDGDGREISSHRAMQRRTRTRNDAQEKSYLVERLRVRAKVVPEHAAKQSESQVSPPSTLVVLLVLEMRLRVALLGLQQMHERPGPA